MATESAGDRPRASIGTMLALVAVWAAAVAVVNPIAETAANDDFTYAVTVKGLVEEGEYRLSDWQMSTIVAQELWAVPFCLPGGFSLTALRISTLVLGAVGIAASFLLFTHFRLGRGTAAFATLLVGFNPIYFGQSHTFMTDVPFYAVMMLSTWLLVSGVDGGREGRYWSGLALAMVAVFVRQIGLGLFAGLLLGYPLARPSLKSWACGRCCRRSRPCWRIRGYDAFLGAIGELPGDYYAKHGTLKIALLDIAGGRLGALEYPVSRTLKGLVYHGLFLLPMLGLLAIDATRGWSSSRRWASGAGSAMAALGAAVGLDRIGLGMPMLGNLIVDFGMGIRSVPGQFPTAPGGLWVGLTAAGIWGGAVLAALLVQGAFRTVSAWRDPARALRPWHLAFMLGLCGMLFVPAAMMYGPFFDRYLMPLLPFLVLLVTAGRDRPSAWAEASAPARLAAGAGLAAMAALSVTATHDYLEWNRVRWDVARAATADRGIDPSRVNSGFEFNNYLYFDRVIASEDYLWPIEPDPGTQLLPGAEVVVAVGPMADPGGRPLLETYPCDAWLPYSPDRIYLYGKPSPAPGDAEE